MRPFFGAVLECVQCGNTPVENPDTQLCATCGAAARKEAKRAAQVKVVTPPRKISHKRGTQYQQYLKLRKEYLGLYPVCEVVECHRKATEIHHMAGRENEKLLDVNNFLAVCDVCHQRITVDSNWAISQGYSFLRSTNQKQNV